MILMEYTYNTTRIYCLHLKYVGRKPVSRKMFAYMGLQSYLNEVLGYDSETFLEREFELPLSKSIHFRPYLRLTSRSKVVSESRPLSDTLYGVVAAASQMP